jgi:outer membrane protein TolC
MFVTSCQSVNPDLGGLVSEVKKNIKSSKFFSNVAILPAEEPAELIKQDILTQYEPFVNQNSKLNIVRAVLINPSYISSRKSIDVSRSFVDGTNSAKGVQASVRMLGGVKSENRSTDAAASVNFSVNKLLYDYGAADLAILSAEERFEIAKVESTIVAETLAISAYEAWIDLFRKRKIEEVYSRGLELAKPLLGKIKNISTSGIADKSDLLDAQKRYSSLELGVAEVKSLLILSEAAFLDIFPGSNLTSVGPLNLPLLSLDKNISSRLIEKSNLIKAQKMLTKSYAAEIQALEQGAKPIVSVASTINAPAKNTMDDGVATFGLSVDYIFNDGGKRVADIEGLKARIESLESDIQRLIIENETKYSVIDQQLKISLRRVAASKEIIILAKDIRDTAKGQLVSGRSSISDVMNAEVSLADAEISLINAEADARLASYGIIGLLDGILNHINWSDKAS